MNVTVEVQPGKKVRLLTAGRYCPSDILVTGQDDPAKSWASHITGGTYLFYKAKFPPNAEVTVEYRDITSNFDWFMRGAENVKKLTLICENPATTQNPVMMASLCNLISTLETVDLSRFRPKISNLTSAFSTNPMLKEIVGEIDYSLCTHLTNTFSGDYELENIRVTPGSIRSTFYINGSPKLTAQTVESILEGLADLTGGEAQILHLHKTVGENLTEAQKAAITAKNWTLVY